MKNDYARKRDLIGRTIVGVRWFRFRARPASDNTCAQQPRLLLDKGCSMILDRVERALETARNKGEV